MQKITNIEINNFKSIRHQTIDDCRRINVFIGYPNVGKSNILEALSLFSIDGKTSNFSSYVRKERQTTLFFNGEISKQAEVKINDKHRVVAKANNEVIVFEEQFERPGTSFEKKDDGFIHMDDSGDVLTRKIFNLTTENNRSEINRYTLNPIGKEYDLSEIKKYEFAKNISYSFDDFFKLSVPFGNNIFNIISSNSSLRKEIAELLNQYDLKFVNDKETQTYKILKFIDSDNIFTIPYSMIADTLQRLIFFKTAIVSNKQTILLFEEPEAHMFPPYISKFTNDVIYDENNNQFFITTHSPFVINDFMDNLKSDELAIYIVSYKKETGETQINRMSEIDMHEAYQFGYDFFMNIDKFISQEQHD